MNVSVVSPEEVLFEGESTQVVTRTTEGDVAFLADHAPFLGTLVAAETRGVPHRRLGPALRARRRLRRGLRQQRHDPRHLSCR